MKANFFLVFLFVMAGVKAQDDDFYIEGGWEPASEWVDAPRSTLRFHHDLSKKILRKNDSLPEFRIWIMPSFEGESVIQLEYDSLRGNYTLYYLEASENAWHFATGDRKDSVLVVRRYEMPVDADLARKMREYFEEFVYSARFKFYSDFIFDGTRYYLSVRRGKEILTVTGERIFLADDWVKKINLTGQAVKNKDLELLKRLFKEKE